MDGRLHTRPQRKEAQVKLGVAKLNAGISLSGDFRPVNPADASGTAVRIVEGHEYNVPDAYDFAFSGAIFTEKTEKKGAK